MIFLYLAILILTIYKVRFTPPPDTNLIINRLHIFNQRHIYPHCILTPSVAIHEPSDRR